MASSYQILAVIRAKTVNAYRFVIFIAFAASIPVLAQLGMPTSWPLFAMLGLWGAAVFAYQIVLGRIITAAAADLLQMVAFIADLTFLSAAYALIGGAWWLGAATHSIIATFSLASLPKRNATVVVGYGLLTYATLIYAQATGLIAGRPFLGVPVLTGNPQLAIIVGVFGLISFVASAAIQNAFVRIMRRAQDRYRLIVDTAPEMIIRTDIAGIVVSANAATIEQSGRTDVQMMGRPLSDFIFVEDRDLALGQLGAAASGSSGQFELRYVNADGSFFWVSCTCNPIREDDQLTGLLLVARDISAAKRNESTLRETEDKLRQSQKMEAIGRLAGGVAHDFNNLLTVIGLHSEMALAEMSATDPQRESLEKIREAGAVAANLTKQLLAFSRKQLLQPQVVDLNSIVAAMEKLLQRLIGVDITIRTRLASDLRQLSADPGQLEQIVMNLCVNARDAMPNGGVLTIETTNVTLDGSNTPSLAALAPGAYVRLAVSDTGIGMSRDTLARVFEPFFTTKRVGEGTGLGLATVYGIVSQSGGTAEVSSTEGKGTQFTLYFPALASGVSLQTAGELSERERSGSATILMVDDGEALRQVAHRTLSKAGYHVLQADGGLTALRLESEYPGNIDLLLTDVIMPQMTGPETARRIREQRPDIRILYMSGYAEDSAIHPAHLDAKTAFLQKPFTAEQLLKAVHQILTPI